MNFKIWILRHGNFLCYLTMAVFFSSFALVEILLPQLDDGLQLFIQCGIPTPLLIILAYRLKLLDTHEMIYVALAKITDDTGEYIDHIEFMQPNKLTRPNGATILEKVIFDIVNMENHRIKESKLLYVYEKKSGKIIEH